MSEFTKLTLLSKKTLEKALDIVETKITLGAYKITLEKKVRIITVKSMGYKLDFVYLTYYYCKIKHLAKTRVSL